MLKNEIITQVSVITKVSNTSIIENIVDKFISFLIDKSVTTPVNIQNFGVFKIVKTKGRDFINPLTGKCHKISDYYFPKFKQSDVIQSYFNKEIGFQTPFCEEHIVKSISDQLKMTEEFVSKILKVFLSAVVIGIDEEERLYLNNFATFKKIKVPERTIENHFSGKAVKINAYYKVKYQPSRNYKEIVKKIRGDTS